MKKVLLIPFMLLCMMLFTVPAFAMENEPKEFRGIPWGAALPENNIFGNNKWGLKHLIGSKYRRNEEVSIGGAKITSPIEYDFYDGWGFVHAMVSFSGHENYNLIRKACIENWGEPDKETRNPYTDPETNRHYVFLYSYWIGEKIDITLSYESEINKSGELRLGVENYIEILNEERAKFKQRKSGF